MTNVRGGAAGVDAERGRRAAIACSLVGEPVVAQAQVDEARARRSRAVRAGRRGRARSTISWAMSRGFLPSTLASGMAQLAW